MESENELLTVPTAALEKDVHVKSVYRAIQNGRLRAERQGKTVLVRRRDLIAWQPRNPQKHNAKSEAS